MLHCQKWRPYKARRWFLKPNCAKEERNGPTGANQNLPISTAELRHLIMHFHPSGGLTHHPESHPFCSCRTLNNHCCKWHQCHVADMQYYRFNITGTGTDFPFSTSCQSVYGNPLFMHLKLVFGEHLILYTICKFTSQFLAVRLISEMLT